MSEEKRNPFPTSVSLEELYGPQFKPDPPKQAKGIWRLVGFLIFAGIVALVICFLFGQQ